MNKLYKWEIDVPATLNKSKALLVSLDKNEGAGFRIEKAWIAVLLDAIAATDAIIFQIAQLEQNEKTALYAIDSEYEVYTAVVNHHLAEAALVDIDGDINLSYELKDIRGTIMDCSKKNYFTQLVVGQAGATNTMKIKMLAQYVNPKEEMEDWNFNLP